MKRLGVALGFFLSSCGGGGHWYITYNYHKGVVVVATVGSEMMNTKKRYEYRTDAFPSPRNAPIKPSKSTYEETLTYSGKQGTVIKILYREITNNFGEHPPLFTQELTYDIADNQIITFREIKIRVVEARDSLIMFSVLEAPAFKWKSGDRAIKTIETSD